MDERATRIDKRTCEGTVAIVNNEGLDDGIWEGNSDLSVEFIAGD